MDSKVEDFITSLFQAQQLQQNINLAMMKSLLDISGRMSAAHQAELGPSLKQVLEEIKAQQKAQQDIHANLKKLNEKTDGR